MEPIHAEQQFPKETAKELGLWQSSRTPKELSRDPSLEFAKRTPKELAYGEFPFT